MIQKVLELVKGQGILTRKRHRAKTINLKMVGVIMMIMVIVVMIAGFIAGVIVSVLMGMIVVGVLMIVMVVVMIRLRCGRRKQIRIQNQLQRHRTLLGIENPHITPNFAQPRL